MRVFNCLFFHDGGDADSSLQSDTLNRVSGSTDLSRRRFPAQINNF